MRSRGTLVLVGVAAFAVAMPAVVAAQTQAVPTFTKDIAPIFQAKSEACHRPGSIAPMSLVTFEAVRPWVRSIKQRVETPDAAASAGEDITDTAELGIYFYPKGQEPKYRQTLHLMGTDGIDIPANCVKATQEFFVMRRGRVESFQPHMHLRGKAMSMEAILPNGQTQILSHVADFNFNWHNSYVYTDEAAPVLPKGTILKITAWQDNTSAKKSNPEPNTWVGGGGRTVDEMAHAWVNVTYLSDADYEAELAAKKAREARNTPQQQ